MNLFRRLASWTLKAALACIVLGAIAFGIAYWHFAGQLPNVDKLNHVQLSAPLKVYTADNKLIAEYGPERRSPLKYSQFPPQLIHAVLSAEDAGFFHQPGVSIKGLTRAAIHLILTGRKTQGGSTITMQVARNYFLTDRKTYSRKFKEIILALKIDRAFSKKHILQLYLNKIYYGQGAYGIAAAAHVYYGKQVNKLTLAQTAMLAGLPQAPSEINPIVDADAARDRRAYVLGRMHALHYINDQQYQKALKAPITASTGHKRKTITANYVGDMVRQRMVSQYGKKVYSAGYKVITTLNSQRQMDAVRAVRQRLIKYTEKQGYRGPIGHIGLHSGSNDEQPSKQIKHQLHKYPTLGGLVPAVVTATNGKGVSVYASGKGMHTLVWSDMSWAQPKSGGSGPALKPGDVVRVAPPQKKGGHWKLSQVPKVEAALVAVNPHNGAIQALVGGFSHAESAFNRVTMSHRQPGSSFKPYVYSAALNTGMTQATLIPNVPINLPANATWRPQNYERNFGGPTPVRQGLIHSINLVSVRILQRVGLEKARHYITRFGFPLKQLPNNLTLALGSANVTPLQMARGYSVFANGGSLIKPYYIQRVIGPSGKTIYKAQPEQACPPAENNITGLTLGINCAPRSITQQNAYIMTRMMHDVIESGTGQAAKSLGRKDLSGKTGTTNKQVDAWFDGFNANLVTITWMGFDQPKTLGPTMTGARAALPIWISFMGAALKNTPPATLPRPPGLITARIDPTTGKRAGTQVADSVFETFRRSDLPPAEQSSAASASQSQGGNSGGGVLSKLY